MYFFMHMQIINDVLTGMQRFVYKRNIGLMLVIFLMIYTEGSIE